MKANHDVLWMYDVLCRALLFVERAQPHKNTTFFGNFAVSKIENLSCVVNVVNNAVRENVSWIAVSRTP